MTYRFRFASTMRMLLICSLSFLSTALLAQEKPATEATVPPSKNKPANQSQVNQPESDELGKDKIPRAKEKYMGRRVAQAMSFHGANWLIRDTREAEERPSQVLPQLGLKPGMTVCDMGCGNGFYSIEMAKLIAPGNVLAVDIQPEMLHLLKLRCDEAKIDNVKPLLGTVVDPQLAENSIDMVLMVDVYHEFSHPDQMMAAVRKSLKPGGLVALLEYREEDPRVPIKPEHKMSKKQILKEYKANGFRLAKEYDELPWQHLMFFEVDR